MSSPGTAPLLLDTHYWIWLQAGTPQVFTKLAREAIDRAVVAGGLNFRDLRMATRNARSKRADSPRIALQRVGQSGTRQAWTLLTRDRKIVEYARKGHVVVF